MAENRDRPKRDCTALVLVGGVNPNGMGRYDYCPKRIDPKSECILLKLRRDNNTAILQTGACAEGKT